MLRFVCVVFLSFASTQIQAQNPDSKKRENKTIFNDSIKKVEFLSNIGVGYFPTKYFKIDLRSLVKLNQYEGFRTGIGGITTDDFSKRFRVNGYFAYGFADKQSKYSIGGGIRLGKLTSNSWLNYSYTDDLTETGSSSFLTDKRFFSFFEPRLLNIDLFHRHITNAISVEHKITNHLLSELRFSVSNIDPTYNYTFVLDDQEYRSFNQSIIKLSLQWSPFSTFEYEGKRLVEVKDGYPKFTLQGTQSFQDVFKSDFNFTKLDFRTVYQFVHNNSSISRFTVVGGITDGEAPIVNLYHAYPNNINKDTVLQRFSVAGLNSFETMYFNEFFSDRFATFQFKHFLRPFHVSEWFKPQMVLITRHAIGNMRNIDRHQGIEFETLDKFYSESGFEINNLIFGFGLSFAYRYGGYHLPVWEDNFAFKFTFNLVL
ncbi:MAG: hypothetical protein AAGH46_03055 [Bacteroidota bacterium]